jgi:hypothetical protein
MNDPHREDCRRQHRVIGHYLAVQAWSRRLECIVVVRKDLEVLLGLERFRSARVNWLKEDLEPWFPFQEAYYRTGAPSSIHSLFLSRAPIKEYLSHNSMTTEQRIDRMLPGAPKTARLSKSEDGKGVPSQTEIVSYLSVLAAGLQIPSFRPKRP